MQHCVVMGYGKSQVNHEHLKLDSFARDCCKKLTHSHTMTPFDAPGREAF